MLTSQPRRIHCIRLPLLSCKLAGFNDQFICDERGLLIAPGTQLGDFDVPAKFVHLIFDVAKYASGFPVFQELYDCLWYQFTGLLRHNMERNVELVERCL